MKGLYELITEAFALMQVDDDFIPCCSKPKCKAMALGKAMEKVARQKHDEHSSFMAGAYFTGPPLTFEQCWAFPCRVQREFGL